MKIIPLILALGVAASGFVAPAAPAPLGEGSLTVVASPAFAGVLRPGQSMLVSGTVTNGSGQALDAGTASIYVSPTKMVTRAAVDKWLSDAGSPSASLTDAALGTVKIGELAAGQIKAFSVTVAPNSLAFMSGVTGVFPLEVRLSAGEVTLASQHTAVSWYPDSQAPLVNLSIVTPLSAPPSATGLLDAAALTALTSVGGALYQELDTAIAHTVAMGVDPMIVASIRLLGAGAPQVARDWLQRLESATNDIFALSYADTDQLLWRRAGATTPLAPLSFPVQGNVVPAPQNTPTPSASTTPPTADGTSAINQIAAVRSTIEGFAWPSQSQVSQKDLDFLATGGFTRTLLSSSDVKGSTFSSPNMVVGGQRVTIADDDVSTYLLAASTAKSDSEWAQSAASLTATLAATAAENPGGTLVATLGRSSARDSRMLMSTLNAVESIPWVNPLPLSSALNVTQVGGSMVVADSVDGTAVEKDRVPLAKELLDSETALTQFSSVAEDPTLVTGPQRLSLLASLSATWADNLPSWKDAVRQHLSNNEILLSSVHIPVSSSITFPLEKGNLPIAVRNELDFPVTVFVTVRPERAILNVLDDRVKLVIEANSQAKAFVPVESIANGEVLTVLTLSSATGVPISSPTSVVLNVQAGWETTATIVLAIIVILLFGAGIWREIRRRRKPKPTSETDHQEPT